MKALVKIAVVVLVVNALARVGWASWHYYQFKDAAQQEVTFGWQAAPAEIRARILARAGDLELPVAPADVSVRREGLRTFAEARYTQDVEVLPRYAYTLRFGFEVDAVSLSGLK